jgi:ubiquinone/menaquinone biosynthesis C-methylase UbiE
MSWNSTFGAEVYDRYVREQRLYRCLNERLVRRSGLEKAARVLDLACGTGATTLACLEAMDARAEIVGVDASAAMIGIARGHVLDPRARFQVVKARDVHKALRQTFDRVVCNAAFWQFPDQERVFAGVAHLLTPGGLLVFNVPADRIQGAEAPIHPFQIALARELQHWKSGSPEPPRVLSLPRLLSSSAASGLALQRHERIALSCRQGELMELMSIPPLIRPLAPTLSHADRTELLARASRHVDPEERVSVPWHFFSFQKRHSPDSATTALRESDVPAQRNEVMECSTSTC